MDYAEGTFLVGIPGVIANWVNGGMQEDPLEMAGFVETLSNLGLQAFLD